MASPLNPASTLGRTISTIVSSPYPALNGWIEKTFQDRHWFPRSEAYKLLEKYDEEELKLILSDFLELRNGHFSKTMKEPCFVTTAGGPGAGKSTLLEEKIKVGNKAQCTYIDPDRTCMRNMRHTCLADIKSGKRSNEEAYNHWRDASNFIAQTLLALAFREGRAIAFGSTSTSPHIGKMFTSIQTVYDYKVRLLHLTCDEPLRKESNDLRNREWHQSTTRDFEEKGKQFYQMLPKYLANCNQVTFYWRDSEGVKKVAEVTEEGYKELNPEFCAKVKEAHDREVEAGFWSKSLDEKIENLTSEKNTEQVRLQGLKLNS